MEPEVNIYIDKKEDIISEMFNDVSLKYDFLNKILSFGIDCRWRKTLVKKLQPFQPRQILDVATGTGDLAICSAKLKPDSIKAIDISDKMLLIGQKKVVKRNLENIIQFEKVSCSDLPYNDESFDAVIMSFGVRNFQKPLIAMNEIFRVTKKNGVVMILEFGMPKNPFVKIPFLFYFTKLLPFIGGKLSGNRAAYSYLTSSVKKFSTGNEFLNILKLAGFLDCYYKKLTFGVTYLYIARKL